MATPQRTVGQFAALTLAFKVGSAWGSPIKVAGIGAVDGMATEWELSEEAAEHSVRGISDEEEQLVAGYGKFSLSLTKLIFGDILLQLSGAIAKGVQVKVSGLPQEGYSATTTKVGIVFDFKWSVKDGAQLETLNIRGPAAGATVGAPNPNRP